MTKTYLVTGAAGSLGRVLVDKLSEDENNVVRAFDSDEYGLSLLPKKSNIRKIHGSVVDAQQVLRVVKGSHFVIHCAALKNLDISEYNTSSLIGVNVTGTYNVAIACQEARVLCAVFMSSDKAVSALSTYGVTKLLGERIWQWAYRTIACTRFVSLRSGNFCESRGNVFEVWHRQITSGETPTITDPAMRRYFIRTEQVADLILRIINEGGDFPTGTVVVPKMKEYTVIDLFKKLYPGKEYEVTGSREGEVLREELLCKLDRVIRDAPDLVVVRP